MIVAYRIMSDKINDLTYICDSDVMFVLQIILPVPNVFYVFVINIIIYVLKHHRHHGFE